MVFGLFYRRQSQDFKVPEQKQLRTPSPSVADPSNHSPPLVARPSPAPEPPPTPSPPPQQLPVDTTPLLSLILSVPPQTLHAYSLAHLDPSNGPPPSPTTIASLTSFFSTLAPPPRLHCVRCHKFYFDIENDDRSCLVPHDDESAEVERLGWVKANKNARYETLWGCCGRTVEGDGDMGPPDGWCYEGKHTTDLKRARFRADSTLHDDKLVPCSRLRCHRQSPSSTTSSDPVDEKPRSRKRTRKTVEHQDSSEASVRASPSSIKGEESDGEEKKLAKKPGVKGAMKKRSRPRKSAGVEDMDVDEDDTDACEKPVSKAASTGSAKGKAKSSARPASSVKKVKSVPNTQPKSTVGKGSPPVRIVAKHPLDPPSPRAASGRSNSPGKTRVVASVELCNLRSESAEEADDVNVVKTKKRRKVA